ncbi:MAG: helix-turn-helix transcriptional regulator [Oscillospiraceae bacterium]|nr:helix-turn-helix transcriptional regulator [Oscillospiraceae bacterium]
MGISYKKLWHLLLDKEMNKSRLRESGIHSATIAKMNKGKAISTKTIEEICRLLDCQPGDIMEYVADDIKI